MAAPAYDTLKFSIPAGFASVDLALEQLFQGLDLPNDSFTTPPLPRERLTQGTGAGQFNAASKFYTASASGVTSYDLTTLLDPLGNSLNLDNARYIVVLNYATTAGYKLLLDGTASNAWTAPFNGITTAKLVIPPGWADGAGNVYPGRLVLGGGAAAGLVTSGTSKVVALDAGANTIPHAFFVVGCDT